MSPPISSSSSSSSSSVIECVLNESRMKREGFSPFGALCDSLSSSSEAERTRYQRYQTKSNQERSRSNLLVDQYERQRLYDRSERTRRHEGFYPDARLSSATPEHSDAERHRLELDDQHRERVQRDKRIQERKEAERRRESLQNNSDRSRSNVSSSSSSSYSNPRPGTSQGYNRPPTSYGNNIRPTFRGEAYQNVLGYNYSSSSSSSSGSSSGNVGGNSYGRGIGDPSWQRGKY